MSHRCTSIRWLGAAVALAAAAPTQAQLPTLVAERVPAALASLEFTPAAIAWLDDRRIVLADAGGHQLVVASRVDGSLRKVGRSGGGPGEFRSPIALHAGSFGIVADDIGARRLSHFDTTLAFVRSAPTPGATLRILAVAGSRARIAWVSFSPDAGGPVVSDVDLGTGAAVERYRIFARDTTVRSPAEGMPGGSPFISVAPGVRGEMVAADPRTYRMVVFDSAGKVLRRFGRPGLPPAYRTPEEIAATVAPMRARMSQMPGTPEQRSDVIARMEKMLASQPKPQTGAISGDSTGRIWVTTARQTAGTELDVFSPAGAFIGTVRVPGRVLMIAVRLPWLVAISERTEGDDEGAYGLDVYRIR